MYIIFRDKEFALKIIKDIAISPDASCDVKKDATSFLIVNKISNNELEKIERSDYYYKNSCIENRRP